jgi:signal transduction histidine kinase
MLLYSNLMILYINNIKLSLIMKVLFNFKNRILFFFFILSSNSLFANKVKLKISFSSYHPVTNLDSLEALMLKTPNTTDAYTDLFLKYEHSYLQANNIHSKYSKELVNAWRKETNPGRKAMFNYLLGWVQLPGGPVSEVLSLYEALGFYEAVKDTLGMVNYYGMFISKNYGTVWKEGVSITRAKMYMQKIAAIARHSSDLGVQIRFVLNKTGYPKTLEVPESFEEQLKNTQDIIQRIKKDPAYWPYLDLFYNLEGVLYRRQKMGRLALQSFMKKKVKEQHDNLVYVLNLQNIAYSYFLMGDFKRAKANFEKLLSHEDLTNEQLLQIYEFSYQHLGIIYEKTDPAKAAAYFKKALEINTKFNKIENQKKIIDLQALMELHQKEKEIKTIAAEKKRIEEQNFKTKAMLSLVLLFAILIGLIAVRFYKLNIRLKKITRSRDKLFNILSHDLRSPLSAYLGIADTVNYLLKTKQFSRIIDLSQQMDINAQKLDVFMTNLFQWSMAELEEIKPSFVNLNLKDVLTPTLGLYKSIAEFKQLGLHIDLPEVLYCQIDRNLFSTIIRNLLDNAIKYCSPNGTVSVVVEKSANKTILKVSNNFSIDPMPDFATLYQLINKNKNFTYGEQGMGLGLLLVKEFTDALRLKINFRTEKEVAIFEIELPISIKNAD